MKQRACNLSHFTTFHTSGLFIQQNFSDFQDFCTSGHFLLQDFLYGAVTKQWILQWLLRITVFAYLNVHKPQRGLCLRGLIE
jgi:hypothetical protein